MDKGLTDYVNNTIAFKIDSPPVHCKQIGQTLVGQDEILRFDLEEAQRPKAKKNRTNNIQLCKRL